MKIVVMAEFNDVRYDARVVKQAVSLASGYSVQLYMYNASITKKHKRAYKDVKITEYPYPERYHNIALLSKIRKYLRAIRITLSINFTILIKKAHVYHAHNLVFAISSFLSSRIHKGRLVYDAHELYCERQRGNSIKAKIRNLRNQLIEKLIIRRADATFQTSQERAQYVADFYGISPPTALMNCVPKRELKKSDNIRKLLRIPEDMKILFFSGGFYMGSRSRAIDKVIESLRYVEDVVFVMMGFGNLTDIETIKFLTKNAGVGDRVFILPPQNFEDVLDYTSSADIGVVPFRNISLSAYTAAKGVNKLFEYLMAGIPIVASDFPSFKEIIKENPIGEVGDLFDVEEPKSIANAIISILRDNEKFAEMKANAYKLAVNYYNWENEEKKLLEDYKKLLL